MRFLLSILTAATLAACASAGSSTASREVPGSVEGTYEFFASVPEQHLRGTLRVHPDTMFVDIDDARCAYAAGLPNNQGDQNVFRFGCGGAMLTFDRRNPVQFSKWSATIQVPRRREVCARYDTVNGRQVCVSRTTETYYVAENRSGGIQLRRLP